MNKHDAERILRMYGVLYYDEEDTTCNHIQYGVRVWRVDDSVDACNFIRGILELECGIEDVIVI